MPNIIPLPQSTFQAPGFVHPNDYSGLTNSIDSIFTAYQQGKARAAQLQGLQLQNQAAQQGLATNQANFMRENQGLVPQDFNQQNMAAAMQPAPSFIPGPRSEPGQPETFYTTPSQAPVQFNGGTSQQPQIQANGGMSQQPTEQPMGQTGLEDPKVAILRDIMTTHLASQRAGAQQAGAQLYKTEAEAAKAQSDADLNNFFSGGKGGGITVSDWAKSAREDVRTGKKAPSQLYTEASRVGPQGMGKFMVDNALAGLPVAQLEADYAGKTALATTKNSSSFQVPLTMAKSVLPTMDLMDKIVNQASENGWQPLNKLQLLVSQGKGDRNANALTTQAALLTKEINSIIPGGSDAQLDQTIAAINTSKTKAQMKDSMGQLRNYVYNKIGAFGGQPQPSGLNPTMPGLNGAEKRTTKSGISYTVE